MTLETVRIFPEWQREVINAMGRFVLYDPSTLQVFGISARMATLLTSSHPFSPSAEEELWNLLQPFRDQGLISLGSRIRRSHSICSGSSVHAVIAVAADCNHRCSYCWNGYGRFGKTGGIVMDRDVGLEVIEKIFSTYQESKLIEIEYYGGEPLIAWDTLMASVNRAEQLAESHGKKVTFSITTNGSLLSEQVVDFLTQHKFWVAVSIDGDKDTHDSNRILCGGGSSWDAAVRGAHALQQRGMRPAIRATVCSSNKSLLAVRDYLAGLGFERIIVECVDSRLFGRQSYKNPAELAQRLYEEYAEEMIHRQLSGVQPSACVVGCTVDHVLEQLWYSRARDHGCGLSQSRTVAFDVRGNPYPCRIFLNNDRWMLGHEGVKDRVSKLISICNDDCRTCEYKRICGCACVGIKGIGADRKQHCERIQSAIRCAMWILCEMSALGGEAVNRLVDAIPTH
jgi:uncharacterized protein